MAFWLGIRASFSVFYVALLEDFAWKRGESAGVQSMALITYTVFAPVVGSLVDRIGPKKTIVPGILILALGLFLCSTIHSLSQFYVFYGIIVGIGITAVSIVPFSAILAHWFEKTRGLASGIAVSGMGFAIRSFLPSAMFPPVLLASPVRTDWQITEPLPCGKSIACQRPAQRLTEPKGPGAKRPS